MGEKAFYDAVRATLFRGRIKTGQMQGLQIILAASERLDTPKRAYVFATAYHETGRTMQPVEENLNYSAAGLLKTFPKYFTPMMAQSYARRPVDIANRVYADRMGNGPVTSGDGYRFRGRGYVQITGRDNYERFGIVDNPEEACRPEIAARILVDGMEHGSFTGLPMSRFINDTITSFVGARAVVNGHDRAAMIAGYALSFNAALRAL